MFFEKEDNAKVISSFIQKVESLNIGGDAMATRLKLSKEIIKYIEKSPDEWDKKCQFNIENVGDKFVDNLRSFTQTGQGNINNIYIMSYRFLCEFDIFTGGETQLNAELSDIKYKIQSDNAQTDVDIRPSIHYVSYAMPLNILKKFINDPNIGAFQKFEQKKVDAENLKKEWDVELQAKTADVDVLKKSLEKYKEGFNFVGLYQGFDDLAKEKQKERDGILKWLITLSVVIFIPIIVQMGFIYNHVAKISSAGFGDAVLTFFTLSTFATFSLVAIAIYYFRVLLFNYKSVKSQLLQIDLRKTLCRFIQSYATYSSKIKKQDPKSLEKFESIIFSGIATDERNQPSPFYVGEQIEKLIEKFTKR